MKSLLLVLTSLLFISCSNMTVGFEEDSPFYNGPLLDTREDAESEDNPQAVKEQETQKEVSKSVENTKEITPQENETTFSYERDSY